MAGIGAASAGERDQVAKAAAVRADAENVAIAAAPRASHTIQGRAIQRQITNGRLPG